MGKRLTKSHDGMVRHVARHLKQRFYQDVRARAAGFPLPDGVPTGAETGYRPDVTMLARNRELHVLEVETPESLGEGQSHERWRSLARHARERGGSLWVVVPSGYREAAEGRLQSLGVGARIWEV